MLPCQNWMRAATSRHRLWYIQARMNLQDGGTGDRPVQVLQRAIKQSIKVTKDISQASYDGVNTYGAVHNDPLTVLLGLFNGEAVLKEQRY